MSYYSSHSSYATPSRGSIQRASYYNSPIHSRNYSSQERGGLSERARYKVLLFRPPQHPSNRLGSLISRFEALDAVSRPVEIFEPKLVPVQHSTSFLQSNIKGGSQPNGHQRRLSTIFSPRPASQGRYENVFPEDESPPDKDDVFTCPPYHSVGSIKKSEILKLRQMPSLTKVAVVQAQDPTKTVGRNALSECPAPSFHKVLPIRSNSREASIRDKIRFFDGGTDPRTPPGLFSSQLCAISRSLFSSITYCKANQDQN
ncbi:hypothetical protein B0O99DRAFT_636378 [Bisporella sp. PMI_857]|nr:hypothetical protein B0O99DRAFT_636378 [Bisporella sp. PMI_857]